MPRLTAPPLILTAILAAACQPEPEATPPSVGLANPASTYCVQSGGRSEIRSNSEGQRGVCVLPDGSEVDEWEYYRANNPA